MVIYFENILKLGEEEEGETSKCTEGHFLTYKDKPFSRWAGEGPSTGECISCKICGAVINLADGYYRCDDQFCNYDLCN